jgi:hypothetical protein
VYVAAWALGALDWDGMMAVIKFAEAFSGAARLLIEENVARLGAGSTIAEILMMLVR